ncbi:MAG: glycogen synthase [Planctomycetota bacterium]
MHIVMVATEISPAAKVGGLADVISGLAKELMSQGHQVEVMLPMYHSMRYDLISQLHEVYNELWVPNFNEWEPEQVFSGHVEGVPCFFFTGRGRFHRSSIYGYDDDLFRFVHFSRAVMEFLLKTGRKPDILHCHDWHTGLVPVLLYDLYAKEGMDRTRVVYTLHNIEHQGLCFYGDRLLASVGLPLAPYFRFDRLRDHHQHGAVNLMKGGIVYSNSVTTVSPTYLQEIRTPIGGRGLDATLNAHAGKLVGILNGIDYKIWNPGTDPLLALDYTAEAFDRKFANKDALRERLGLLNEYRPVLACISRLVHQKGVHLIRYAIQHTLSRGGQFVLLGNGPDVAVQREFHRVGEELASRRQSAIRLEQDEELAHLIYAGADMLLVPSLFEPCGLTQLIALRYGTVPLVRKTGGLADTVFDVDSSGKEPDGVNGYAFNDPDTGGVASVINRACEAWFYRGEFFSRIAQNGMRADHSWGPAAREYLRIYDHVRVK